MCWQTWWEVSHFVEIGVFGLEFCCSVVETDSLTARYVRTFRKKMKDGNPAWLRRRSPLVAHEQI